MSKEAFRVPGEHVPWPISAALLLASLTTAGAASTAWAADGPGAPPAPAPQASPAPPAAPPVGESSPPAASAPQRSPAAAACPRLIVGFALGATTPSSEADPPLARLAAWLLANDDAMAVVDGHADAAGNDERNLTLSRSRATHIAQVLVRSGVARSRLTTRGFGAFNPVEGEPEAAAVNRRVVIHVRGGAGCPNESEQVVP